MQIFDFIEDEYKIEKPIRLIELFAGVGSQAMALRNLGADFEHYRVVVNLSQQATVLDGVVDVLEGIFGEMFREEENDDCSSMRDDKGTYEFSRELIENIEELERRDK